MDSRIQLLLEDEFLDRVITPIERYMTDIKMYLFIYYYY